MLKPISSFVNKAGCEKLTCESYYNIFILELHYNITPQFDNFALPERVVQVGTAMIVQYLTW